MRTHAGASCFQPVEGTNEMSNTPTARRRVAALDAFADQHGYLVDNAMQVYVANMRAAAREARQAADVIATSPPAPVATREGVVDVTPSPKSLRQAARALDDAADRTQAALDAWRELTGGE